MSRVRKRRLGSYSVVLALVAMFGALFVPFMPAQADHGHSVTTETYCDNGEPMLRLALSGYPQVTIQEDAHTVSVTVDGEFKPAYSGEFNGPGTYEDFVPLGDGALPHNWQVVVDASGGEHGDETRSGTSDPCVVDDDDDGVPNGVDQCPGTPPGASVNADGCSSSQLDSDGDGVNDDQDNCPNQPGPADNGGCPEVVPSDSDNDGVNDENDQCPGTPAGASVDSNGCAESQKDSDGDGVMNDSDECPNEAGPASNNGCPVEEEPPADSDGDGVSDDRDECPDTPPGTKVNGKGCPVGNDDNDNSGNNGTIKVDGVEFDSAPDNQPHVGCTFQVDFYGYGKDVGDATVSFALQAPTNDGQTLTVTSGDLTPDIGEDGPGGGTDLDASETYTLAFTGEPHAQGYHVKLTVNAPDSKGADVKHKVFWVSGCEPEDEEPAGSSDYTVTCEQLVINEPKDVTPEGSEYQYFLDGDAIEVGSHELAPGDYTLTLEVDGEQVDSDTFTVKECDGEEDENTYSVTSTCDAFDPENPLKANGTISLTVNNTDDETDLPLTDYEGRVYYPGTEESVAPPKQFGEVADGESVTVTFEELYGVAAYDTAILDGDGNVVFEETVLVEFCDDEPPLDEGDVKVVPVCGAVKVTNKEDVAMQFFHGSFDEIEPDGIVMVQPGETVRVKTDRRSLDWFAFWDDGKMASGENLKVKQKCGDQPDQPDNPDQPDSPDNPDTPNVPNWPDVPNTPFTPGSGVPDTGADEVISSMNKNVQLGALLGLLLAMLGLVLARRRLTV